MLRGAFTDGDVDEGTFALIVAVRDWMPILPDPYVANFRPAGDRRDGEAGPPGGGIVGVVIEWRQAAPPEVTIRGALPGPRGLGQPAPPVPDGDDKGRGGPRLPDTQTRQGTLELSAEERKRVQAVIDGTVAILKENADKARAEDARLERGLVGYFSEFAGTPDGVLLLDVSSAKDQIGVQIGLPRERQDAATGSTVFSLDGLVVQTPADNVRVFALPQVQWEPVRTLEADQDLVTLRYFPTPLASATDGGPTVIGVGAQRLLPTIPDLVLDGIVESFSDGRRVAMLTTLPFGIKAVLALRPAPDAARGPD
jgi:hypothetical protein